MKKNLGFGRRKAGNPSNPIEQYVLLSQRVEPEGDKLFTAFCDELGLATFSTSEEKASNRLQNAILATLNTAEKKGAVRQLLKSKNIRLYSVPLVQIKAATQLRVGMAVVPGLGSFSVNRRIEHRPYILRTTGETEKATA